MFPVSRYGPEEEFLTAVRSLLLWGGGFQPHLWLLPVWLCCGFLYFCEKNLVIKCNKTTLLIMLCSCDGQAPAARVLVHHSRREGLAAVSPGLISGRTFAQMVQCFCGALNSRLCVPVGFLFYQAVYTLRYAASTSWSLSYHFNQTELRTWLKSTKTFLRSSLCFCSLEVKEQNISSVTT